MQGTTVKRELIFATFCSAVFAALLVFQSCASKTAKPEGDLAESEETIGDASLDEGADTAEAEADAADLEATLDTSTKDAAKNNELTENSASSENSLSEFDIPKTSETTETTLDIPSAPPASEEVASVSDSTTPSENTLEQTSPISSEETSKSVSHSTGHVARARTPRIPGRAVKRKGTLLNRFYFVRAGDKATKVSELLYGSGDRAGSLMRWNGQDSKWTPGDILYYASATDAADTQMKSFYQERSVTPEEVTVQPGQWLSQIAKAQLGHPGSWKEIAVVNGLASPDAIEKGQKLAVYPVNLSGFSEVAQGGSAGTTETASAVPEATPPVVEPPSQVAPPPPPVEDVAEASKQAKRNQAKGGLDVAKLLEQNLFAVVVGSALVLLLVALMAVNKRKKKSSDELADDGFSAKARRK